MLDVDKRKALTGYILPEPGLFVGVESNARRALFFYNWLKHRSALMFRLTTTSARLSNQLWRQFLGLSLSPTLSDANTKSEQYRSLMQDMLKDAFKADGALQLNAATTGPSEVFWQERALSRTEGPDEAVSQEILWELYELNFRFEFLALDQFTRDPTLSTEDREDLLLACFPGSVGRSLLIAELPLADRGFAAECWRDRAPFILAFRNVMKTWRNFSDAVKGCKGVDLAAIRALSAYSEEEILVMEKALLRFYTQSFFDFFGRAAIVPHRLARHSVH